MINDLACEDAEAFLPLVADGALTPEGDPALFEHIARCPACQESLARHDLVSLALAPVPRVPRLVRVRLPLPWAFASAAGIACAASVCWNALSDPRWSVPHAVGMVAVAAAPAPISIPPQVTRPRELRREAAGARVRSASTLAADDGALPSMPEVITLGDDADGGGVYILLQDGRCALVPSQPRGGQSDVRQVSLNLY